MNRNNMTPGENFLLFLNDLDVPVLDIGTGAGSTDYIDFIKPDKVDHAVMKGIDKFARPFLVMKATGTLETGDKVSLFQTFFQRYTGEKSLWMGCGHYGKQLFDTVGGMTECHFDALKNLLAGKKISAKDFSRHDNLKMAEIKL